MFALLESGSLSSSVYTGATAGKQAVRRNSPGAHPRFCAFKRPNRAASFSAQCVTDGRVIPHCKKSSHRVAWLLLREKQCLRRGVTPKPGTRRGALYVVDNCGNTDRSLVAGAGEQ